MPNKFRLHTPEELHQIAKHDFERFKEISKYYYENDFEYFENTILPIIDEHKHKKLIVANLNPSNAENNTDNTVEIHEKKTVMTIRQLLNLKKSLHQLLLKLYRKRKIV